MKRVLHLTTLTATILIAGVGVVQAEKNGETNRPSFEALDINGDGAISQEEMSARHAARFAQADTDGSGGLSAEELQARMSAKASRRAARMLERMDADGDGQLTFAELSDNPRAGRRFERIDRDGDGSLSRAEFDAAREKRAKRSSAARKDASD